MWQVINSYGNTSVSTWEADTVPSNSIVVATNDWSLGCKGARFIKKDVIYLLAS